MPPTGFERTDDAADLIMRPSGAILYVRTPMLDISATEVRRRIKANDDAGALLPEAVWAYIRAHGLYG